MAELLHMTEEQYRLHYVSKLTPYIGAVQGSAQHQEILDTYNDFIGKNTIKVAGLPRSTKMWSTAAWCACTYSVGAILNGVAMTVVPTEISCTNLIKMAQAMGIWVEDESLISSYKVGNGVLYDWDDGKDYATTDNKGGVEHIGTIYSVDLANRKFTILEGNYSKSVKLRTLDFNARYLRGFICPRFDTLVDGQSENAPVANSTPDKAISAPALSRGSKDEAVRALQALLNLRLSAGLALDASFGRLTEAAVTKANAKIGIQSSACGIELWNWLINR